MSYFLVKMFRIDISLKAYQAVVGVLCPHKYTCSKSVWHPRVACFCQTLCYDVAWVAKLQWVCVFVVLAHIHSITG